MVDEGNGGGRLGRIIGLGGVWGGKFDKLDEVVVVGFIGLDDLVGGVNQHGELILAGGGGRDVERARIIERCAGGQAGNGNGRGEEDVAGGGGVAGFGEEVTDLEGAGGLVARVGENGGYADAVSGDLG